MENFNNTRKLQLILFSKKIRTVKNNKCIPLKQIFSREKPSVISIRSDFKSLSHSYTCTLIYFLHVGWPDAKKSTNENSALNLSRFELHKSYK